MPAYMIGTAVESGAAGIVASQLIGLATVEAGMPVFLLEVEAERVHSQACPRLFASTTVPASQLAAFLKQADASVVTIVAVRGIAPDSLAALLPLFDAVVVPGTYLGVDLQRAYGLYEAVSTLQVRGRSGRTSQPWLLPVGWSCPRNPGIRLRGWQRRLEEVAGERKDCLRCLPLVLPWYELGHLQMANRDRLNAVGRRLLEQLALISTGVRPKRPPEGLAGGDPWPDCPAPATSPSISRTPGERLRVVHSVMP